MPSVLPSDTNGPTIVEVVRIDLRHLEGDLPAVDLLALHLEGVEAEDHPLGAILLDRALV
jgi:hypothetical protein